MTVPLIKIDNECIFSLKHSIIGSHDTTGSTERLYARARTKVHADPNWHKVYRCERRVLWPQVHCHEFQRVKEDYEH
jgi:hypothetical protein